MKCSLKTFDRSMRFRCPPSQLQERPESFQLIRLTEELHPNTLQSLHNVDIKN